MNAKKIGILLLLPLTLASLTACGKKKTTTSSSSLPAINAKLPTDNVTAASKAEAKSELALDMYLKQLIPQIDGLKSQISSNYSDMSIVKNGTHGLRITFQLNQTYTIQDDTAQQIRDTFKGINGTILTNMGKAGVINPTLHFVVLNGDGSAVIDEDFTG